MTMTISTSFESCHDLIAKNQLVSTSDNAVLRDIDHGIPGSDTDVFGAGSKAGAIILSDAIGNKRSLPDRWLAIKENYVFLEVGGRHSRITRRRRRIITVSPLGKAMIYGDLEGHATD